MEALESAGVDELQDVNEVGPRIAESIVEFFRNYCRVDMKLEENILSKEEYRKALAGKKQFRDFAVS